MWLGLAPRRSTGLVLCLQPMAAMAIAFLVGNWLTLARWRIAARSLWRRVPREERMRPAGPLAERPIAGYMTTTL